MVSMPGHLIATYEVEEQVIEAELGGSINDLIMCNKEDKHPGHHDKFIQMDKFGPDYIPPLPRGYPLSKEDLVMWVKSCAAMVCRVNVKYCSLNRPDTWDGHSKYPLCEYRGKRISHSGTGWLSGFTSSSSMTNLTSCPICEKCREDDNEETCWKLTIFTACHVVYDESEAQECEVIFFEDKPNDASAYVIQGGLMDEADMDKDSCCLSYFTHDVYIGEALEKLREKVKESKFYLKQVVSDFYVSKGETGNGYHNVSETTKCVEIAGSNVKNETIKEPHNESELSYDNKVDPCDRTTEGVSLPVVLISQPHGRMKYISVGTLKSYRGGILTYTTPTCPGCSGGLLINYFRFERTDGNKQMPVIKYLSHRGTLFGGDGSSTVGVPSTHFKLDMFSK